MKSLGVYWTMPSRLTGEPLYVVALRASNNRKTGNMRQVYYLPLGRSPVEATQSGRDDSVCGDCRHRPVVGGECYVAVARGPLVVYRALHRGRYAYAGSKEGRAILDAEGGAPVRYGAWGDPAAVSEEDNARLVAALAPRRWTAYTHQWRNAPWLKPTCMASVDNLDELAEARAAGWRTFRVRGAEEELAAGEFVCPAAAEADRRLQCNQCYACNGNPGGRNGSGVPVIIAHGFRVRKERNERDNANVLRSAQ